MGTVEVQALQTRQAEERTRPWESATFVLIGLNVLVFAVMVVRGVSFINPNATSVLNWGADYGPLTLHGQWWRMFASMFLHFGIIHLLFNMIVLFNIGLFMEALCGRAAFVILYLVAGLGGSAASLTWHPMTVSAGASGAIFGLYGGLLGYLVMHRGTIPAETVQGLMKWALTFVGYNLLFGLRPGVDMAAHIGGLGTGFVVGLFLVQPRSKELTPSGRWRPAAAVLLGLALIVVPLAALPKPDDYLGEVQRLVTVEAKAIDQMKLLENQRKAGQITDQQYADAIEKRILPPWEAERQALANLKQLPRQQAEQTQLLLEYMTAREEGWQLLAAGTRSGDKGKIQQGLQRIQESNQVGTKLKGGK